MNLSSHYLLNACTTKSACNNFNFYINHFRLPCNFYQVHSCNNFVPTSSASIQSVVLVSKFRFFLEPFAICIVRDIDTIRQMEIALIENLQREDLNPMEAAKGIQALMKQYGYTQEKVSARLGKSRPAVANLLRLLSLPEEISEMVRDGRLSAGHARVLAGLGSAEEQIRLGRKAAEEGLSVRQLEQAASAVKAAKPAKKRKPAELSAELSELQDKIRMKTGLKSTLTGTVTRGRIVLQYSTRDELERLNDVLDLIGDP